jgi:hypothetical protein
MTEPPASYELPGARRVVGAGIAMAIAAASDIRRASIYIGLLALGALGPAVVYTVAVIDRFDLDLTAMLDELTTGEGSYLFHHPELIGPLLFLEGLVVLGVLLLFTISIDAQAIGVALLGGHAGARPLRLPEAITRARQVFWRLAGGGFLVGTYSTVIQIVLGLVLGSGDGSNPALDFLVAILATLATVPFAYLATGIVLGDVGPIEALRRSNRLFRARPSVAVVVVLFTLATSAIETFALGAGLDLVARFGELLGLDATAGGVALILPLVLSLAAVTAFGSLLFTIAALVAAPQVAAFLGLTFYAGGLERARTNDERPAGFRWVTRSMDAALVGLIALALIGVVTLPGGG